MTTIISVTILLLATICRVTRKPLFTYHKSKGLFWFRIFGKGLSIKDTTMHPKLFSERMRYRGFGVGKYYLNKLR